MQCENAIKTGKKTDLSKMLQTKLEQLQRERENAALGRRTVHQKRQKPSLRLVLQHLQQ